jgi:hypothetical protein
MDREMDNSHWKANQNMRVKRMRTRGLGRTEWTSVVRKAKVEIKKKKKKTKEERRRRRRTRMIR